MKYRIFDREVSRQWNDFEGDIDKEIDKRFFDYWCEDRDNCHTYVITVWNKETKETTYHILNAGAWRNYDEDGPFREVSKETDIEELSEDIRKYELPKIKPDKDYIIV